MTNNLCQWGKMCQSIAETLLLIKNILELWGRMGLKSQTKEQTSSKVESWGFLDKSFRSVNDIHVVVQ